MRDTRNRSNVTARLITNNYRIISLSAVSLRSMRVREAPSSAIVSRETHCVVAAFSRGFRRVRAAIFFLIALSTVPVVKRERRERKREGEEGKGEVDSLARSARNV